MAILKGLALGISRRMIPLPAVLLPNGRQLSVVIETVVSSLRPGEAKAMSKVLRCREVGMDCDFVARGNNEQEVLSQAAEHASRDHGMEKIPEDIMDKVKAAIHDE